ncbi:tRNA synthetases class I, catalytic domain-domain-containing protein [Kockovaella imperatae]|uniref:glutamine--tRNA ligase n=1 Tax=Kockovaella imperatae TaxID=4999 RepID=A0A1Y1UH86_9TREE|nr:tRNA synthetases class I, catalytic domain-domain-containing protein [Kockovaella imperatae]ORX36887.1 tRNA synthetases class I, catalytic domain-domain-containing protein [Kockovaella imperatae]
MPPKATINSPEVEALASVFVSLGLAPKTATELARQPKSGGPFKALIDEYGLEGKSLGEKPASALVKLSSSKGKIGPGEEGFIVQKIIKGDIKSPDQVTAAVKFVEGNSAGTPINEEAFDKACGVGVDISTSDLPDLLRSYISSLPSPPDSWTSLGPVLGGIRSSVSDLRWADAGQVKTSLETLFTELFGSKEEAAKARAEASAAASKAAKPAKGKPVTSDPSAEASSSSSPVIPTNIFREGFLSEFHKPGENPQSEARLKAQHLDWTKGKVYTRFPPEPNGYLHIGHVKAIMIDFGYAKFHGGRCYLRFDDTNPEAEEGKFFQSILETVRWLGFEPWKITYSSDNFDRLYELAVELIRRGKAYVCTCDVEKVKEDRGGGKGNPVACEHRNRPVEESLHEFDRMKNGEYPEKKAVLRMKMDLDSGNPYMWDTIAYRVKLAPHHRTADKWKIYPTYDFTHCLCDSFENISHSLCTVEFIPARESYEWLCDALSVYKPRQYEFARLNLQGTFLSKRKIARLVSRGLVKDWDDPRLYTIVALRRRGVPPGALLAFVSELGVTTVQSTTELQKFESCLRAYLEESAPRLMMVLNPIKVVIDNVPDDYRVPVEVPLHPKIPAMGTVTTSFTKELYIDADDFREVDSPDYFRLAPGKTVGLFKAPHPVTYLSHSTENGRITQIRVKLENDGKAKKAKAYIQWVSGPDAVRVEEVRYFHPLFKSDPPPSDFESDVDPKSLEIFTDALIEPAFYSLAKKAILNARKESEERLKKAKEESAVPSISSASAPVEGSEAAGEDEPVATAEQLVGMENIRFQGMRLAYFAVDRESKLGCLEESEGEKPGKKSGDKIILNRIVSLKEDSGKKA